MFFKCLLFMISFSIQTHQLLGRVRPPKILNNKSLINDPNVLAEYAKYEQWNFRVVNGWPAKLGDVPYQIGLKYLASRSRQLYITFCGATIIGPRKLLSAAHCFEEIVFSNCNKILYPGKVSDAGLSEKYAVAGTLRNIARYKSDGQWRSLEKVQFPKSYDFPTDDIAVVVPKYRFDYNDYVGPIPMASLNRDYQGRCLASGYGRTGPSVEHHSPVLLLAHLALMPIDWCSKVMNERMDYFVCTSIMLTDVGQGDSGGPLVCADTGDPKESKSTGVLVGVTCASLQTLPLLGNVLPPVIENNTSKSFINADDNSISTFAEYEDWNPRVINGWDAKLGDVPYQIGLKVLLSRAKSLYVTFCGAAIIAPRKLLSAAHCFEEKILSNCNKICYPGRVSSSGLKTKYAVAGTLRNIAKYNSDGQWRSLEEVYFPVKYKFPKDDIAVVIPKKRFDYNDYVGPIPTASLNLDYQGKCLVSGYGRVGQGKDDLSTRLLLAHLTIIPNKLCSELRGQRMELLVCTSVKFMDVGKGDSGGPLVCKGTGDPEDTNGTGVIVGVVSGTIVKQVTIFTRVSRYQKFISSVSSVSMLMYKYNMPSCSAITIVLIYKTFLVL